MAADKIINDKYEAQITEGEHKIFYQKDAGPMVPLDKLKVPIGAGRMADIKLYIKGKEYDVPP